jgi:hypothetical protein
VQTVTAAVTGAGWSATLVGLASDTYTLRVTQQDAAGNVGASPELTFVKADPLTVTSLSPATLGQGAEQATVQLSGTGFDSSTAVSFSGAGVTSTVASRTSTSLSLRVTVTAGAATGSRAVTVTAGDGATATCAACLDVVAGPTITSVSPTTLPRGTTRTVTVTGSGYRSGLMTVAISGSGVTVDAVQVTSSTALTVVLTTAANAGMNGRTLTVTDTGTFGRAVRTNAVTVVR